MNSWKQIRIPLLAFIFTAVILVLLRVVLVTAFSSKQKDSSKLSDFPLLKAVLVEEN